MAGELGYQKQGLASWSSLIMDESEQNPDLQWPLSIDVFDKMRREDSQVASVMRAVTLPIRSTDWSIDPAGAPDEVVEFVATDLGLPVKGRDIAAPLRRRDRFSWSDHLRLALLELVYGHSFFEQVYREQDGMLRLRKLAWRPPRTIDEIKVARDGGLIGIVQGSFAGGGVTIPVDRLVAYVNDREGGNWVGQSLLRAAYKNWLLKDRMLRAQALTVERNGLGIPKHTQAPIPDAVKGRAEREQWLEDQRKAGLEVVTNLRAGETAGVTLPNGDSLELMGVTGDLPDTDKPIRYHDEQIARAVLAHFLNLGTETGSWALGSTFADFFTNSLNAEAQHIADVTQQHVVEDLVDLNFGEDVPAPVIVCEPISADQPATSTAVKELIECGAITPDPELEVYMRTRYGLPQLDAAAAALGTSPAALREAHQRAQIALTAATAAQKVYLATDRVVLNQDEARALVESAGAVLTGPPPDTQRVPNQEEVDRGEAAEELG